MSTIKANRSVSLSAAWDVKPLGEMVQPTRPRIKPSEKPDLPFIGMENVEAHTMKLLGTVPAATMKSSAVHFQSGDVLYGRLRPYLNKIYRPEFEGLCSAEFIVFPKTERIDSRYLQYFLNSSAFVSFASHLNTGDRPRVDFEQLAPYPFPLAPPDEQKHIVAEIEKQFSRLDEAVASLKRTKANLQRYKAAVIKAAVEGKLTEEWRKAHPDVEPASKLLERILIERRARWRGKGKYKEPVRPESSNLTPLPKHWVTATVDSFLVEPMCNGISVKGSMSPPGVPALRLNAMTERGFDYREVRYIPIDPTLAKDLEVRTGDFFVSRGSGSLRLVGRGTVAQSPPCQCVFPDTMIRLRTVSAEHSNWISTIWASELIRRQIEKRVKTTAGIWKISQPELGSIMLPVPPEAEQSQIVAEVERRLSVIDELESTVDANLTRAERLRQSILGQAFSGKLLRNETHS